MALLSIPSSHVGRINLPCLDYVLNPSESFRLTPMSGRRDVSECIEGFLLQLVRTGDTRLRVVPTMAQPSERSIFSARQTVADGRALFEVLNERIDLEPITSDDLLFLHQAELLLATPVSGLLYAIHDVAKLVASSVPPRMRDGLFLATQAMLVQSLSLSEETRSVLMSEAKRSWMRLKLNLLDADPMDVFDAAADLATLETRSPVDAALFRNLDGTLAIMPRLQLPVAVEDLSEAAYAIQAIAIFAEVGVEGSA